MRRIRQHLIYANVMATFAVFGVLAGGGAYAASMIGPSDIARNAVHSKHIKGGAVTRPKLTNGAINSAKLASGSVRAPNLGPIIFVKDTITIPTSSQDQGYAQCPSGTRLIGGGGAAANFAMPIGGSQPADNKLGWIAYARNESGSPVDLRTYALCLKG